MKPSKRKRDSKEKEAPGGAPNPKRMVTRGTSKSPKSVGQKARSGCGASAQQDPTPSVTWEAKPDFWYNQLPPNHGKDMG